MMPPEQPNPARVVADVDVLVCDLFVDGEARAAMDIIRSHRWLELLASDSILEKATQVITQLADDHLAQRWRDQISTAVTLIDHPEEDTPALACAYHGRAGHVLTYDTALRSPETGLWMRTTMPLSVRSPAAFLSVVDVASLYEHVHDGPSYPGPDADPRS